MQRAITEENKLNILRKKIKNKPPLATNPVLRIIIAKTLLLNYYDKVCNIMLNVEVNKLE